MFSTLVPSIVAAPIAGVWADRMDRRYLIALAALGTVFSIGLLSLMSVLHVNRVGWILVLAFLFGWSNSTLSVAISSLLPGLVPKPLLLNAFSLQAIAQRGTEFLGPAVSSPLLAWYGVWSVYLFAGLLYLFSIVFVFLLAPPKPVNSTRPSGLFRPLMQGFSYLRQAPKIAMVISLVGFHCMLTMAFMGMLPAFVRVQLAGSSGFYGAIMSTVGLGSILGTLVLAGIQGARQKGALYLISAVFSGLSLALLGLSHSHVLAIVSVVLMGSTQAAFMTLSLTYIQEVVSEEVRGRVTSVYFVLAAGLMSVANWGYGAIGTFFPPHLIMISTGTLFVVIVLIYGISSSSFRNLARQGALPLAGPDASMHLRPSAGEPL